jgi:hypothetical protein
VQELVEKRGKLPVPIPQEFRAPVGNYAAKLVSKIGLEIRTHLPNLSVPKWNAVDEAVKAPMLQRIEVIHVLSTLFLTGLQKELFHVILLLQHL